jgi:cerevisin
MAIFLSQNDYTPPQLVNYMKKVSTLITEDFTINNTGAFYSENKTVVDNAINTGYQVRGRMDQKTQVNILFSYPNDSQSVWIYGQSLSQASPSVIHSIESSSISIILPAFIFIIAIITL